MIFVTVGTVFPFDRLIRAMDAWAAGQGGGREEGEEILAQIGVGGWRPGRFASVETLPPADYGAAIARSRLVVAHAGIGAVIAAGEAGRPIVVLPRRREFGEHVSDHQLETAGRLAGRPGVFVAWTEDALAACIAEALAPGAAPAPGRAAEPAFAARLRAYLLR